MIKIIPYKDCYYYSLLNNENKILYELITSAISKLSIEVYLPTSSKIDLQNILNAVFNDQPYFYHLNQNKISYYIVKDEITIKFIYSLEIRKINEINLKLKNFINNITNKIESKSPQDKVQSVHNFLIKYIQYDYNAVDLEYGNSHTILSPLLDRKGLCSGISKLFMVLLFELGIKSYLLTGYPVNEINNPKKAHMWNIVKINEVNYHVDVTWDIKLKDSLFKHMYLLLDDELASLDHYWTNNFNCNDKGLYKYTICKNKKEVKTLIDSRLDKKEENIIFYLLLTKTIKNDLLKQITEVISDIINSKRISIRYQIESIENRIFHIEINYKSGGN